MAFIRYTDGTNRIISPEQGLALWRVMSGEVPATPRQQAYLKTVRRLYLNWHTAPESYRRQNAQLIESVRNTPKVIYKQQDYIPQDNRAGKD